MKIEIDLPDWVENKNIYIFADFELVARRITTLPWEIKTGRCIHCGKCCKDLDEGHRRKGILPVNRKNNCAHLEQRKDGTYWCKYHIPIFCLTSNPRLDCDCVVEWKTID